MEYEKIDAKRTMATNTEEGRERGPRYDGSGDYMEWKRKIILLQFDWQEDGISETKQIRRVLGLLSGAPFLTATDGGDITSCIYISGGQQIIRRDIAGIFAKLEERREEAISVDEAAVELFKLGQGKKGLEEYTTEFDRLTALAGTPSSQKPLLFFAGLSWGIKNQLGAGFLPEKYTFPELWRAASEAARRAAREERRQQGTRKQGGGGGRAKGRGAQTTNGGGESDSRKCYYCDKPGHLKRDCNTFKRDQEKGITQAAGKQKGRDGAARGRQARETKADDVDINIDDSDED